MFRTQRLCARPLIAGSFNRFICVLAHGLSGWELYKYLQHHVYVMTDRSSTLKKNSPETFEWTMRFV